MAKRFAVRWRPPAFRSTTETIITNAGDASLGQRVHVLQLVVYDDAQVGTAGNPYVPGAPATEQFIEPAREAVVALEVSAFTGLSNAAAQALWDSARDQQIAAWQADPDIGAYVKAAIGRMQSEFVVVG